MASPTEPLSALSRFTKLSRSTYLLSPPSSQSPSSPRVTIILLFWMNASPRHISKYLFTYLTLHPHARILYILTSSADFLHKGSSRAQRQRVSHAVSVLRAAAKEIEEEGAGEIHIHVFSNGGCMTLQYLAAGYADVTGGEAVPAKSLIFDSAPGKADRGRMSSSYKAFAYGFPRFWLARWASSVVIVLWILVMFVSVNVLGLESPVERMRRAINDRNLVGGERRCYIYSETDELIKAGDVEEHARDARERGNGVVEMERFEGTAHVAHMRGDPERYWAIVRRVQGVEVLN
ncbi:hypothetical protein AJ80_04710 [Polytolypa hystricis UAMH7299]|uniref:Indole-diterpene biosynthesis protein PaxU n=1 Tax=Polytolypa hystricis (strain UAMH7299) TaxID=1447883 RepID=A0A2B7YA03_POLH7|nr:hypothetical protein AJ80_04710 [Polytolypa hystricis UAMH7299]